MTKSKNLMGLNGNEAIAYAVKQCNVDVVSAYPITPQTIIVEKFSEFVADGEVKCAFVPVESEHSALSVCIGAAALGARTFTATSSQGLALMWELMYIASGLRLPIVMAVVNRALSAPINIHCDHSDSMGCRDSSWIQIYCEDAQEAYDTTIQAFRIAEHEFVQLPVMITIDGFTISHTMQNVNLLRDDDVKSFVDVRKPINIEIPNRGKLPMILDPENPLTFGSLDLYDYYFEHKLQQHEAIKNADKVVKEVHDEYFKISGRRYGDGLIDAYGLEDAEDVIIVLGSTAGTVRYVTKKLRHEGKKVGMLRIRTFRPFPIKELTELLKNVKNVGVMDRSGFYGGVGGPVFVETIAAFYNLKRQPKFVNYIYGLGGRDTPPKIIEKVFEELPTTEWGEVRFLGVR
ncbi:MAG: pyruvate ferredoxin oxidoreductase [Candidatus Methanomethylicia archaeon]|nr:pyruvate ferredoxin oxidoreductase [Candidatus Methanomethylicia archaeon]MCX8169277.1 pyruvate ferredoxin oxidoreductase [Candidatus Methanomethylicia archaeon]MDW7988941.1 pyruvate ferredoxin oxidoreductase [Nitrososphaerota archaeon]